MKRRKIGVLDTGIGGMYTLSKIRHRIPDASLFYVGDCRNLPHNIHSREWIAEKAQLLIDFLLDQGVDELVIACHTISTLLPQLHTGAATVFDIISPTLGFLQEQKQVGHSLFIGTRTTIESGCYRPDFLEPGQSSYISAIELATLIEKMGPDHESTFLYLDGLLRQHFDELKLETTSLTVFPVCTHYFLVRSQLLDIVQAIQPHTAIDFVEPSSLLANSLPPGSSDANGELNIFLNEDKSDAFSQRLRNIMKLIDLEKERVAYIKLGD